MLKKNLKKKQSSRIEPPLLWRIYAGVILSFSFLMSCVTYHHTGVELYHKFIINKHHKKTVEVQQEVGEMQIIDGGNNKNAASNENIIVGDNNSIVNNEAKENDLEVVSRGSERHTNINATTIATQTSSSELQVLNSTSVKTYMDYRAITSVNSNQYQYIYNSGEIYVAEDGFLRTYDGYIGVALGSYFGNIGDKYVFTLDTGIELRLVKVEEKADKDTDSYGYTADDGSVIEFVIDAGKMRNKKYENGYIYGGNFNNCPDFNGKIVKIVKVN